MSETEKHYYSTENWLPEQAPCVIVEGDYVPVKNIESLNCEEDPSGRDLLTFLWKGERKQSFIFLKYL